MISVEFVSVGAVKDDRRDIKATVKEGHRVLYRGVMQDVLVGATVPLLIKEFGDLLALEEKAFKEKLSEEIQKREKEAEEWAKKKGEAHACASSEGCAQPDNLASGADIQQERSETV